MATATYTQLTEAELDQIEQMDDRLQPVLNELPSLLQGAVLAALLARWLTGHEVVGDVAETLRIQDRLLARHCQLVAKLVQAAQEDDPEPPLEAA